MTPPLRSPVVLPRGSVYGPDLTTNTVANCIGPFAPTATSRRGTATKGPRNGRRRNFDASPLRRLAAIHALTDTSVPLIVEL
jgi:hypothetical protein